MKAFIALNLFRLLFLFCSAPVFGQTETEKAKYVPFQLKNRNLTFVEYGSMKRVSNREFTKIVYFRIPPWQSGSSTVNFIYANNPFLLEKEHIVKEPFIVADTIGTLGLYSPEKDELISLNEFSEILPFSLDGIAPAKSGETNLWGYLNTEGKVIIPCKYSQAFGFNNNGFSVVNDNGKYQIIDKTGKTLPFTHTITGYYVRNNIIQIYKDNKQGYARISGEIVVPPIYEKVSEIYSTLLAGLIKVNQKVDKNISYFGVYDARGDVVIPISEKITDLEFTPSFIKTYRYYQGSGWYSDRWEDYYNLAGIKLTSPEIRPSIMNFHWQESVPQLFPVYKEVSGRKKYGFINTVGTIVIPLQYQYCEPFHEGKARCWVSGNNAFADDAIWISINEKGEIIERNVIVTKSQNIFNPINSQVTWISGLKLTRSTVFDALGNEYKEK